MPTPCIWSHTRELLWNSCFLLELGLPPQYSFYIILSGMPTIQQFKSFFYLRYTLYCFYAGIAFFASFNLDLVIKLSTNRNVIQFRKAKPGLPNIQSHLISISHPLFYLLWSLFWTLREMIVKDAPFLNEDGHPPKTLFKGHLHIFSIGPAHTSHRMDK